MKTHETMRPKFYLARKLANELWPEKAFAVGFYSGQMEKVLGGACDYCMFRPNDYEEYLDIIKTLVDLYELDCHELNGEIWVCKEKNNHQLEKLRPLQKNSEEYHMQRAVMCGIKKEYRDGEYHLRGEHEKNKKFENKIHRQ